MSKSWPLALIAGLVLAGGVYASDESARSRPTRPGSATCTAKVQ